MDSSPKTYTFDRVVRIVIGLTIAAAILWLLNRLSGVLLPFFIGWLIAYLLHPIVNFFQYKCRLKSKILSIAVTLLGLMLVGAGVILLLIPSMVEEFSRMGTLLVEYVQQHKSSDFSQSPYYLWFIHQLESIDFEHLLTWDNAEKLLERIAPQFMSLLSGTWQVVSGVFIGFITLLYVIFILIDYDKISNGFIQIIPTKYRHFVEDLLLDVETGMNKYFRGQATVALIVGVLFAIGFSIVGLPLAITMGLFIGVLNLVPYLQTVGIVPVLFLALLRAMESGQSFWWVLLWIAVVFIVVQVIQDLYLVPKIMGKAMGLNPAVILLSLSIWGALFGIVGMIIALPATTLISSYYKRFVLKKKKF